jgi:molecular chaperone GrpE
VAEAKREGEKVVSIDGNPVEREADSSQSGGGPAAGDPPAAGSEASLASELEKVKAEKEELMQTMIRRQADFENFRKRTERDRHEEGRRGVERLIVDLIPVLDAFDLALQAHDDPRYEEYRKGVTLIRKQLWDTIAKHGVQRIEAAGKIFDPNLHQAIERVETTKSLRTATSSPCFRTATSFTDACSVPRSCALPCTPEKARTSSPMKIRPSRRTTR